jgi:hypothetical protein
VAAVTAFREFTHPRMAAVYDALGPDRVWLRPGRAIIFG